MAQLIARGLIISFDNTTYTATVQIVDALSTQLSGVPIANHMDGTSALAGAQCAVLFFDETNPTDCVILAAYPNSTFYVPTPPPGRITFVTGTTQINAAVINNGVTSTYTLVGTGGIVAGALAVLFKAFFSSSAASSHIDLAAHGGDLSRTCSIGDVTSNTQTLNGGGILPLDSAGKIDIKANGGNCTVTLTTYGYII